KIIRDLYASGKSRDYEELRKGFPDTLFELLRVPGLGAKRIKVLYEKLKIKSLEDLKSCCNKDQLKALEGFGEKSQAKILEAILALKKSTGTFLLLDARWEAEKV